MCIFIGYPYTYWNYTILSIKTHLIFEIFLLVRSFILYISQSHYSDPFCGSLPPLTFALSSAPLLAYSTFSKIRSSQKAQLCQILVVFHLQFYYVFFCGDYRQCFAAHSCLCTSWCYSICPDDPAYHQIAASTGIKRGDRL